MDLKPLTDTDYDFGLIFIKNSDPIPFQKADLKEIKDTEICFEMVNVTMRNSEKDPGRQATVRQAYSTDLIQGYQLTKYNAIQTPPPGLILSKGGQA